MKLADVLIDLYSDPDAMARFKADPGAVLKAKGVDVPEGVTLKVVEDTAKVKHLVLPYLDERAELTAEELEKRTSMSVGYYVR
ncbi:MAG: hypothetical protein AB7D57_15015 [Desulfovibrionaceae bacterium]